MSSYKKMSLLLTCCVIISALTKILNYEIPITNDSEETLSKIANNVPDLVERFGYTLQIHQVQTEDGYILNLHRIPHGKSNEFSIIRRPVALLAHCLTGSSAVFLHGPENTSLAYSLAEEGYDVWMMNIRGSKYSQGHVLHEVDSKEFWDFSLEEPATFDYPAAIDYILNVTSQKDLFYIGYSMGSTQYFIMLSERPEYNQKIKAGFVMGPAVFFSESNFLMEVGKKLLLLLIGFFEQRNIYDFGSDYWAYLSHFACTKDLSSASKCHKMWSLTANSDDEGLDFESALTQLSHTPQGSSIKAWKHYLQLFESGNFVKFQRKLQDNAEEYNLNQVVAPTKIYIGANDPLSTIPDAGKLAKGLKNSLGVEIIDRKSWNHMDFAYSNRRKELVFDDIIKSMNDFDLAIITKRAANSQESYNERLSE